MVIISSFYNEEYLLPWWLEHHKHLGHGVLFDYFSTDNSVEIIKRICPTWEIRPTRNKDWDFKDNDDEFMEAEREFNDYKIVLTTTEFLVGTPEFKERAYAIPIIRLVDNEPDNKPTYDKPLIDQKCYGYLDRTDKHRFLHNYPDGQYNVGRHKSKLPTTKSDLRIFKYVYSPWTDEFIERKLNMKTYVNPENIKKRWGLHHTWDRFQLEQEYIKALNGRNNLLYR